jgi:hypothetical protein
VTEHTSPTEPDEQTAFDTRARHLVVRFPGRKAPTIDVALTTKQLGRLTPSIEDDDNPGPEAV